MQQDIIRTIDVLPGVEPVTENTANVTKYFTYSDKIRMVNSLPEKIGGWLNFPLSDDAAIDGCVRNIFPYQYQGKIQYLIGTSTHLYHLTGSDLTNITPLETSTTAIANSLATYYVALANNPLASVDGSQDIVVTDTATRVRVGDTVTLSGASTFNGMDAGNINTSHLVRAQTTNSFTITISDTATATGSGGGVSVILATGIMTVTMAAHGLANGDRVKITGAVDTGGILAAQINLEFIIRNVSTNTFDIDTAGLATSSVSSGGGAGVLIQTEIPAGNCDATFGVGYGYGLYGAGLYGVPKTSTSSVDLPRIWSFDLYGDKIVLTPGGQTGAYSWDKSVAVAPTLITNAPTAINYIFSSNESVITLGADDVGNRVSASSQGQLTVWTASATNTAFEDDIEQAATFIAAAKLRDIILLFTTNQVYTMRRLVGNPLIWEIKPLESTIGLLSQQSVIVHAGVAYWMWNRNFYFYRGGGVEIMPSNAEKESTLRKYVFENINVAQASKTFAWYNNQFNEIWWHYPRSGDLNPGDIARVNLYDFSWVPDTMDRTAAEYPYTLSTYPYLITSEDGGNLIYRHEIGYDDDEEPMAWELHTPFFNAGLDKAELKGIVPDSIQQGSIGVALLGKNWPQDVVVTMGSYTISATTKWLDFTKSPRFWQYQLSGEVSGQFWRAGLWQEILTKGTRR